MGCGNWGSSKKGFERTSGDEFDRIWKPIGGTAESVMEDSQGCGL